LLEAKTVLVLLPRPRWAWETGTKYFSAYRFFAIYM
jgi:hypothetical protein